MGVLAASGKLHFAVKSSAVSNADFKRWKKTCLELLNEQQITAEALNRLYRQIHILFFYDVSEQTVLDAYDEIFSRPVRRPFPAPAFAVTVGDVGCISVFLKHYRESVNDMKLLFFEEIVHLVQYRSSEVDQKTFGYNRLMQHYGKGYGKILIERLREDRMHYTCYAVFLKAYPEQWVNKYVGFLMDHILTPEQVAQDFEEWKNDPSMAALANARLIVGYLSTILWLNLFRPASYLNISMEAKSLLARASFKGLEELKAARPLIEKALGSEALGLVDGFVRDADFRFPNEFWRAVLGLWQKLKLFDAV
jgi:hypothetical protein